MCEDKRIIFHRAFRALSCQEKNTTSVIRLVYTISADDLGIHRLDKLFLRCGYMYIMVLFLLEGNLFLLLDCKEPAYDSWEYEKLKFFDNLNFFNHGKVKSFSKEFIYILNNGLLKFFFMGLTVAL